MKIAMINEFSQAAKNDTILGVLKEVVEPMGHTVCNTGMNTTDASLQLGEPGYLTYLNIGVQAALLLNSGAVDFVVTGCGTGQGALMACNMMPGVVCGYCIESTRRCLLTACPPGPTPVISVSLRGRLSSAETASCETSKYFLRNFRIECIHHLDHREGE